MLKLLILLLLIAPLVLLLFGQLGLLAGSPPEGLGLTDGKLKAPRATPNSVSSQASLHPTHPRHQEAQIDPLVSAIANYAQAGDRILVMSNGGFGGIHTKLLKALETR